MYVISILTIPIYSVGKSSILKRYTDQEFNQQYICTIGVDFKVKFLKIAGTGVKLQIWDTAGQERFKAITTSYYRGAHGVLVVYDITNRQTFNAIINWLREIRLFGDNNDNMGVILIGNKVDCPDNRCVSVSEGQQFAGQMGIPFIECSAKTGANIDEAFELMATKIILNQMISTGSLEANSSNKKTVDILTYDSCSYHKCC
ncbi:uncharacterized protein LOC128964131 [Oppia nitens]|uniref:uncharacterized protein LOC128964131 n=1 Tax=Oppia nitens TaxID=1686743 RepID=UPI0023DBDA49|nr:uncharacterized protein LOC128964131 [Oppia nitens]